MGDDLSSFVKVLITLVTICSVLVVIFSLMVVLSAYTNKFSADMSTKTSPNYEQDLMELANSDEMFPVPTIYKALSNYEFQYLAQFNIDFQEYVGEDYTKLLDYSYKKAYVRIVKSDDGLHVWVGDY